MFDLVNQKINFKDLEFANFSVAAIRGGVAALLTVGLLFNEGEGR